MMTIKPQTFLLLFLLLLASVASGQIYPTKEFIDFNNIRASHLVHGDMWYNLTTRESECEFPKGSNKHVASFGALWIGGYDTSGTLRAAGQAFRQRGSDYWPGPIDYSVDTINANQRLDFTKRWARIWKINRSTIDSFRAMSQHTLSNTNTTILHWPAKGNIYATGADTFHLSINRDMAPFADVNGDGIYNALNGDYPLIRGEQMLWWVNNDYYYNHTEYSGQKLYLEIQNSVFAYSLPANVVFYDFKLRNAGTSPLVNLRFGFLAEMNIGFMYDDYVGMDSAKRLGVAYNADNDDESFPWSYGTNIPAAGMMFTSLPGDSYPSLVPAGSFTTFSDVTTGPERTPLDDVALNHSLRNRNANGTSHNGGSYRYDTRHMCDNNFPKTENQKFVLASNDISLLPNEQKTIGMALIIAPLSGGCPSINFNDLRTTADSALRTCHNPPTDVQQIPGPSSILQLYPNPATNYLTISAQHPVPATIIIYDAVGRIMFRKELSSNESQIDIAHLLPGYYVLHYRSEHEVSNKSFLKQ